MDSNKKPRNVMYQTPVQAPVARLPLAMQGTPLAPASSTLTGGGGDILDYLKGRGGRIKELEDAVAEQRTAKEQLALRLQHAEQKVHALELRLQGTGASSSHPAALGQAGQQQQPSVYTAELEKLLSEQLQRVLQLEQAVAVAREQLAMAQVSDREARAALAQTREDAARAASQAELDKAALLRNMELLRGECAEQVSRAELAARIESERAEAAVQLQLDTAAALKDAQDRLAQRDAAGERAALAEGRVRRLEAENDSLARDVAVMQEKLGRGEFGTASSTRVLHLRMNPESEYHKQAAQGQAGELQAQVDALRASLLQAQSALTAMEARATSAEAAAGRSAYPSAEAGAPGMGTADLLSQLAAKEGEVAVLRHKLAEADKASARLKAVFKDRAAAFREAMYSLFGYRVDMASEATTASAAGSAPTTFSLRPQHADSPDALLVFKHTTEGGMQLVPTPFTTGRLAREVDTFVRRFNSIPAFTANLTMESFQKQTQC